MKFEANGRSEMRILLLVSLCAFLNSVWIIKKIPKLNLARGFWYHKLAERLRENNQKWKLLTVNNCDKQ
jgi:hypothetical protein